MTTMARAPHSAIVCAYHCIALAPAIYRGAHHGDPDARAVSNANCAANIVAVGTALCPPLREPHGHAAVCCTA